MAYLFADFFAGFKGRRGDETQTIRQAIHELENYTDQELDDIGLARRDIPVAVTYGSSQKAEALESAHQRYLKAIQELENYSDRDLEDLNLSRDEIPFAVKHGRPGIEAA